MAIALLKDPYNFDFLNLGIQVKSNFYLTAIDTLVKEPDDKPTIGILLCKNKDNVIVDFALKDINKPMGISEFTYTQLPDKIKQGLPTIEQLTEQLNQEDRVE